MKPDVTKELVEGVEEYEEMKTPKGIETLLSAGFFHTSPAIPYEEMKTPKGIETLFAILFRIYLMYEEMKTPKGIETGSSSILILSPILIV